MTLFFLLLLDPSSFLYSRETGGAVLTDHAPSASCATAIPDREPLFVSDDPAEEAECGESAAVVEARRLRPLLARKELQWPRHEAVSRQPTCSL
jgi:hypothetical protein